MTAWLPIVDGVAAEVPAGRMADLESDARVAGVASNSEVTMQHYGHEAKCKGKKGKALRRCKKRAHQAAAEAQRIQRVVRADKLWAEGNKGQGKGNQKLRVAVLDTGIYSLHPDLGDRVVHCEDFSGEFEKPPAAGAPVEVEGPDSDDPLEHLCSDPFGHGSFMAGLIGGNGTASDGKYSGVAPRAELVSVKVAGYDGSTDISKILAGIQWVVSHSELYGIRVLNLSLGSDSAEDRGFSPLNYAVQEAWAANIVVVVSAGNDGDDPKTMMKPGDDPLVITVGSSNDEGTVKVSDDRVPVFSSRGETRSQPFLSKPDLVSPGVHTVSLRSPGSAIDNKFGASAAIGKRYFRGTGTSMSTATVSGIVALMLTDDPTLTPDQVKSRLKDSARSISSEEGPLDAGNGVVDAYGAVHCGGCVDEVQEPPGSNGLGLLDLDRVSGDKDEVFIQTTLANPTQVLADGEFAALLDPDALPVGNPGLLLPWLTTGFGTTDWTPESWEASSWKNHDWAGTAWEASSWKATEWDASSWKGTEWENADWDASSWKGTDWDASSWKASSWKSALVRGGLGLIG